MLERVWKEWVLKCEKAWKTLGLERPKTTMFKVSESMWKGRSVEFGEKPKGED